MSDIKFKVHRMGDPADQNPGGAWGCVLIGDDGKHNTAVTVHCFEPHEHGKPCAQALLNAPVVPDGTETDTSVDPPSEKPKFITPKTYITRVIGERIAAEAKIVKHQTAELPKKEVIETVDGKKVKKMVEDRDLA